MSFQKSFGWTRSQARKKPYHGFAHRRRHRAVPSNRMGRGRWCPSRITGDRQSVGAKSDRNGVAAHDLRAHPRKGSIPSCLSVVPIIAVVPKYTDAWTSRCQLHAPVHVDLEGTFRLARTHGRSCTSSSHDSAGVVADSRAERRRSSNFASRRLLQRPYAVRVSTEL